MSKEYIKHLIQCSCILPQYQNMMNPILHKFIVFSELDDNAKVIPSLAQCNHCGRIHNVYEVGLSKLLPKDSSNIITTIDEIKSCLPPEMVSLLASYELELHSWQELQWIFENKIWGRMVILTKEPYEDKIIGKYIQILSDTLWRIQKFSKDKEDIVTNE